MNASRAQRTRSGRGNRKTRACPRRILQANRNRLIRRLQELGAGLSNAPEIRLEDPDAMLQERAKDFVVAQELHKHLETIDGALQAADRGEYGICEHCGQPIPPERLMVLPEARLCVHCKSLEERLEHRGRNAGTGG